MWLGLRRRQLGMMAASGLCALAVQGATGQSSITPVTGPSDLWRLGLTIQQTSMGWTGQLGPPPDAPLLASNEPFPVGDILRPVRLSGADLYRLNCRGCHKANGSGAPPEINSLIEPVQGTSLVLWEQRMKRAGRAIEPSFARQVVSGARSDLLKRLTQGGQKMPAFGHLQGSEVPTLIAYLENLADVPGAADRQGTVTESSLRIGEHLVKGTCHICHNATGSWPTPVALLDNAVPSLASLPTYRTLPQVIEKVRHGAPVVMGSARVMCRGRMPVFDYLTDDEVAAAYLYLTLYPPR